MSCPMSWYEQFYLLTEQPNEIFERLCSGARGAVSLGDLNKQYDWNVPCPSWDTDVKQFNYEAPPAPPPPQKKKKKKKKEKENHTHKKGKSNKEEKK